MDEVSGELHEAFICREAVIEEVRHQLSSAYNSRPLSVTAALLAGLIALFFMFVRLVWARAGFTR